MLREELQKHREPASPGKGVPREQGSSRCLELGLAGRGERASGWPKRENPSPGVVFKVAGFGISSGRSVCWSEEACFLEGH